MDTDTARPRLTLVDLPPPPPPPVLATTNGPDDAHRWGTLELSQLRFAVRGCNRTGLFFGVYVGRDTEPTREIRIGFPHELMLAPAVLEERCERFMPHLVATGAVAMQRLGAFTGPIVLGVEDERGAREVYAELETPIPTTPEGLADYMELMRQLVAELA